MVATLESARARPQHAGRTIASVVLVLIVLVKILQSVFVFTTGADGVYQADGIPFGAYPPAAARTILALFELVALDRLLVSLVCVFVLLRHRAALPFAFALLVANDLGKRTIFQLLPIERVGAPIGPQVNDGILVLAVVGLVLSLAGRARA